MSARHYVIRKEDMSPTGQIVLIQQADGDVIVGIRPDPDAFPETNSIEFCSIGSGGGKSPRTLSALRALIAAVIEDNEKEPIRGSENVIVEFKA